MILISAVLMLCTGRLEKKLISILAMSYIFISLTKCSDFSLDLRGKYDGIIADAQRYADDIRAEAEKYSENVKHESLKSME